MTTAQNGGIIQPGSDNNIHSQNLQQNIAQSVAAISGQPVDQAQVIPPTQQPAVTDPLGENVKPEADWEDIWAGMKGRPRTEPSGNFLKTFLGRMRKKNPGKEVTAKK